ncbi:MAG: dephospho-CoA kinase [Lachnospiraceae bacterium]|nr:dephospho-CoA kinase [Lachnospiraceae bacterium]
MKFIGITGGVGAGKSEILAYLNRRSDTRVMQADDIARQLCEPGTSCNARLRELFAADAVFVPDGTMDRQRMAEVIFSDEKKRLQMNEIVHPAVREYILTEYRTAKQQNELRYLFLEAALLIEEHYDEICDEIWYIYTSEEKRRQRLMSSRGYSEEKIAAIFASQLAEEEYRRHCVRIIDNNGTAEDTVLQVIHIIDG